MDKDIQRYVQKRLSDDKSLSKWQKDLSIRQEIEAALIKGAHGMYSLYLLLVSKYPTLMVVTGFDGWYAS